VNYSRHTLKEGLGLAVFLALVGALAACSDDGNAPGGGDSGAGGSGDGGSGGRGSGGNSKGGTGGNSKGGTGGMAGGAGGRVTGGTAGTGGRGGTGGTGGGGGTGGASGAAGAGGRVPREGGLDADAGCTSPEALYYRSPGCDGSVAPVCAGPTFDACAITVCACDGQTITGCGFYEKPWAHTGECTDGGAANDAGDGG